MLNKTTVIIYTTKPLRRLISEVKMFSLLNDTDLKAQHTTLSYKSRAMIQRFNTFKREYKRIIKFELQLCHMLSCNVHYFIHALLHTTNSVVIWSREAILSLESLFCAVTNKYMKIMQRLLLTLADVFVVDARPLSVVKQRPWGERIRGWAGERLIERSVFHVNW